MRLHRLSMQAFGPYADRQTVDFDELNDSGVFLLAGPTGAGKTSILDAVCFALYGVVPGERHVRGLRSDHAAPDVAPHVELELTLGGRRLRVERSPEWQRPKRRGDGTTTERARGKLFEVTADCERLVSDRLQEIGHELGPLLGMSAEQFQQVVLLPQGGFSRFLHAGSDERREVLERLFATQRFARIETWVHDRAGRLRRQADDHRAEVQRLLATMAHRAGCPAPEEADLTLVESWRDSVLADAQAAVRSASAAEAEARARALRVQSHLRQVEEAHALARRRSSAEAELAELAAHAHEDERAKAQLQDHRRACAVVPLLEPLREAEVRLAAARREVDRHRDRLPHELDQEGCEASVAELQRRLGELEGLREVVGRLEAARRRRGRLAAELREADRRAETLTAELADLPLERDTLAERLQQARQVLARRADCERALADARARREAAEQLPDARAHHAELQDRVRRAHQHANEAQESHLQLVERRLAGMAAELAGQLADGEACQVCGSTDHPAPSPAVPDPVTRHQQQVAADAAAQARDDHDRARQDAAAARERLALLEHTAAGLAAETAAAAESAAAEQVDQARRAEDETRLLAAQIEEVEERLREATTAATHAREVRDHLTAELAGIDEVVAQTAPQVEAVLGGEDTLDSAVAAVQARLSVVQDATRAMADLADAERHHDACLRRAESAVASAGFADAAAVGSVVLDERTESDLEAVLEERRARRARAQGVLDEPDVKALTESALPHGDDDLSDALHDAELAAQALTDAVSDARAATERHTALLALADQLTAATDAWLPVRREHELADSMSRLVRGTGGDNHLQMRLSSYVLATRLDQVLDAANERLQRMRDSRYTFHRSSRAPRARVRSGLDIEVLDDWTGEARPPSTLSGGETFKLSLALALGLADVISHESGGLDIETLFIDEGFGMLDAETLDEVMDCVDDLRSGGRAVGVVSHVTELRARVSTQLHVTPTRHGSTIRLATSLV